MTRRRLSSGPARRDGFSLVSVIIAMVLLSVGVLALAGANAASLRVASTEGTRSVALQIARSHLEFLRTRSSTTLASEGETRVDETGVAASDGTFRRTVTVRTISADILSVEVKVVSPQEQTVVLETQVPRTPW
ncbi:MAG: prepilin-type N-terminal cleavage/methylation domain-containing protein [Gemmatimonadaceae bacterium]|nr:prepilin-type N-terminal cleavage/methylation domain-containing protein [Gemmatimonadaceae bacterium]